MNAWGIFEIDKIKFYGNVKTPPTNPSEALVYMQGLFALKYKVDTHVLNKLTSGFYFRRFVFGSDVSVKADGEPHARFSNDVLLFLVLEKFGYVIVIFEPVQAVVIDVHFPENSLFCHAFEIAVGVLAEVFDMREQIGMRNARGTAAALCISKDISLC